MPFAQKFLQIVWKRFCLKVCELMKKMVITNACGKHDNVFVCIDVLKQNRGACVFSKIQKH